MFASALPEVLMDYPPDNTIISTMVVSVYALGLAFGPLVIAPLSEFYGRLVLYHVTAILFVVFSIACAESSNLNMLIGFQFLQGCAGAAPITMGGGTVADMFLQTERGSRIAILAIGPLLTLLFGPVAGSFLAAARGWRWVFWLMAILVSSLAVFYLTTADFSGWSHRDFILLFPTGNLSLHFTRKESSKPTQ
jgi:MFS family permease